MTARDWVDAKARDKGIPSNAINITSGLHVVVKEESPNCHFFVKRVATEHLVCRSDGMLEDDSISQRCCVTLTSITPKVRRNRLPRISGPFTIAPVECTWQ
jgi:hypothetical protein